MHESEPEVGRRWEGRNTARGSATGELNALTRDLAERVEAESAVLTFRRSPGAPSEVLCAWSAAWAWHGWGGPDAESFVSSVAHSDRVVLQDGALTGTGHWAGAPVRGPGSGRGALCLRFARLPAGPGGMLSWLIDSYARLAALCIHDSAVLGGLRALERRDELTGCLTDGAVRGELTREIARSDRHGTPVSCCFIDLDRFKQVNTRYGHLEGSRALSRIAVAVREALRASDSLGRFGGDEFVAVLPDTDEPAAAQLGERLRAAVRSCGRSLQTEPIDASIGAASWQLGASAEDVLEGADLALRSAKALGGARVLRASELATELSRRDA